MKKLLPRWLAVLALVSLSLAGARAADESVIFGLTNRSILGAALTVDTEYPALHVTGLSELGYMGLSVRLGESESGLFFSPSTRVSLSDDNFMIGHAYGRSAGLTRRLSSVFCKRETWGTYPVTVDFLPLGTVSKTAQVFVDGLLIGEETYTNGTVTVSTSNDSNVGPSVNPFWRNSDGSVGVLLEFTSRPPITLPSGRYVYADRIFIRANNPLFAVDYVSQVDLYGGGGLSEFSALNERLGAFGRPHRALGEVVFTAKTNKLTVAGCHDAGTDGVMIELNNSPSFSAQFQPVALSSNGAMFHISATSSHDHYYYYPLGYLGPVGIENHGGEKKLRADAFSPSETRVEVLDGTNWVGQFDAPVANFAGSFGTNELEIIAAGVAGASGHHAASLYFELREPATLASGLHSLRGNFFRLSRVNPTNDIGTFASFQVLACDVPSFTISGETTATPALLNLAIEHTATNIVVSWPSFGLGSVYFEAAESMTPDSFWESVNAEPFTVERSRVVTRFPFRPAGSGFFRIRSPYAEIYSPYTGN